MYLVRRAFRHAVVPLVFLCSAMSLLAAAFASETVRSDAFRAAVSSITASELGHHVDVLADDSYEGREAGSQGGRAAGRYLFEAMEECGIQPAGDDAGYFQLFGNGYRNVLGMIKGRDAELKHSFIVLGAHYDHVGYGTRGNSFGPPGRIHNGADDNASGTAGVLEAMQAFAMLSEPPRRSILFAFWDGEEKGLLGSKHFVQYPTVAVEDVVIVLNCDMIGRLRNRELKIYGARTAHGLRRVLSRANVGTDMRLDFIWGVQPTSDHYAFFERNVPHLLFHTGLHENYHRPSDDAELINDEGIEAVSRLLFRVAYDLAESSRIPPFRQQARMETKHMRAEFEHPAGPSPPRLGVSWNREDDHAGILVTRVATGSPASEAGFMAGDRILEFDGQAIEGGDHFQLIVLAAPADTDAVVQRPGEPEPMQLAVTLRGTPLRIGISWKEDKADPSIVMLTRVIPGSAAAQAGLKLYDRIYAVGGQTFDDGNEFGHMVKQRHAPLRLHVERQGILRDIVVHPLNRADDTERSETQLHVATP